MLRAFKKACEEAGLVVGKTMARLTEDRRARTVVVGGSRPGWPHKTPMVSLMTFVTVSGNVGKVRIHCQGTDEDPIESLFSKPILRDCTVPLEEARETLRTILVDRVDVQKLVAEGHEPPFIVGDWTWAIPSLD